MSITDYSIEVMPRLQGGMRRNEHVKKAPNEYYCPVALELMEEKLKRFGLKGKKEL